MNCKHRINTPTLTQEGTSSSTQLTIRHILIEYPQYEEERKSMKSATTYN